MGSSSGTGAKSYSAAAKPHAAASSVPNESKRPTCTGCGRTVYGGKCGQCIHHPDRNLADCPFVDSEVAEKLRARFNKLIPTLPLFKRADGSELSARTKQL